MVQQHRFLLYTNCNKFCAICSIRCSLGRVTKMMFCTLLGGSPELLNGNIFSTSCSYRKKNIYNILPINSLSPSLIFIYWFQSFIRRHEKSQIISINIAFYSLKLFYYIMLYRFWFNINPFCSIYDNVYRLFIWTKLICTYF